MSPPNKPPTIYDVAKRVGVSITTVSRVLNTPDKVNPETRKRILKAIDALGFVPKAEARARALRQTGRIGVITPFFTAPSFVQRLRGIAAPLSKANYELVIYPVDSMEHLHGYISSIPLRRNIDGLIIMSLAINNKDADRLAASGIDTVLIEYSHPKLNSIQIDDEYGGQLAAEHLVKQGHKIVAFLGDIEPPERYAIRPVKSRLTGFTKALNKAGIALGKSYVRSCSYTQKETKLAAHELLSLKKPPTAIFTTSDIQALSVLKVAREMGIKVPDSLAVFGFDDLDMAEYADLTTIRQHLDESGRLATEILLSHIANPTVPLQHKHLPLNIIERQTA